MRWFALVVLLCGSSVLSEETADDPPSLKIIPSSVIMSVGEKKAVYCEGKNLPDVKQFQWISPSGAVLLPKSSKNTRVYLEKNTLNKNKNIMMAALVINKSTAEENGNWTCKCGELEDKIEVFVGEQMALQYEHEDVQAEEGKNVQLDCPTKGDPLPTAQWYKDKTPIPHDFRKYRVITKDANTKLEIKTLNHTDSGTYSCKLVQKIFMNLATKDITLSVIHKPILLDNDNEIRTERVVEAYAILNEIKKIRCNAVAFPPPKYKWTKKMDSGFEKLIEEDDFEKEASKPISAKTDPTGDYSELTLMMRNESYLGEYKCSVRNDKGTTEVIFHVSLGEKPNPPDSVTLVSANDTQLEFNVTCSNCTFKTEDIQPNQLAVEAYQFEFVPYKEGFPADWEASENLIDIDVPIVNPDDELFIVGPLPNSTMFHVRARSRNAAGFSSWLEGGTAATSAAPPARLAPAALLLLLACLGGY